MVKNVLRRRVNINAFDNESEITDNRRRLVPAVETQKSWSIFGVAILTLSSIFLLGYLLSPFTVQVPKNIQFTKLKGVFSVNSDLAQGRRVNGLKGAESIVEVGETKVLIVSLLDGRVVKVYPSDDGLVGNGIVEEIVPKSSSSRPLGLRIKDEKLFVADANFGVYEVNLNTKVKKTIYSPDGNVFVNDLDIKDDIIYFTETSTTQSLDTIAYAYAGGICDGRLMQFNLVTNEAKVLLEKLCCANGIQISLDGNHLVVSEGSSFRVIVVNIQRKEIIKTINLPFAPDNIRMNNENDLLVAGSHVITETGLYFNKFTTFKQIVLGLTSYKQFFWLAKLLMTNKHNVVAVISSKDYDVIRTLHDKGGVMTSDVSQMTQLSNENYVIGSYTADYIVIIEN